ncbi:Zinc finger protein, partial [Armadillidium nasatum]
TEISAGIFSLLHHYKEQHIKIIKHIVLTCTVLILYFLRRRVDEARTSHYIFYFLASIKFNKRLRCNGGCSPKMSEELLSLKWNNHQSHFVDILTFLREQEIFIDATLACGGKLYPAHKFVLSTCSDYFKQMFTKNPSKHPIVFMKDVSCRDLEALLDFMYNGEVNVPQSSLGSLIKTAEGLQIKGLAVPDDPPIPSKREAALLRDRRELKASRDNSYSPSPKRLRGKDKSPTPFSNSRSKSPTIPVHPSTAGSATPTALVTTGGDNSNAIDEDSRTSALSDSGVKTNSSNNSNNNNHLNSEDIDSLSRVLNREPSPGPSGLHKNTPQHSKEEELDIKQEDVVDLGEHEEGDWGGVGDGDGRGDESLDDGGGGDSLTSENNTPNFSDVLGPAADGSLNTSGDPAMLLGGSFVPGVMGAHVTGGAPLWHMNRSVSSSSSTLAAAAAIAAATASDDAMQQSNWEGHHVLMGAIGGRGPYRQSQIRTRLSIIESDGLIPDLPFHPMVLLDEVGSLRPHMCNFCGRRFKRKDHRLEHERIHTGERPFVCGVCGRAFIQKHQLVSHSRRKHESRGRSSVAAGSSGKQQHEGGGGNLGRRQHALVGGDFTLPVYLKSSTSNTTTSTSTIVTSTTASPNVTIAVPGWIGKLDICGDLLYRSLKLRVTGYPPPPLPPQHHHHQNLSHHDHHHNKTTHSPTRKVSSQMAPSLPSSNSNSADRPFVCQFCDNRFKTKQHLVQHVRLHTGEKPYVCSYCFERLSNEAVLSPPPPPLPSDSLVVAPTSSSSYSVSPFWRTKKLPIELLAEEVSFSPSNKTFDFRYKEDYREFYNSSLNHLSVRGFETLLDRPFKCSYCPMSFKRKYTLQEHVRIHLGQRPYSCSTCGKSFTQSSSLGKHLKDGDQHHRPFPCKFCEARFKKKQHLQNHERIHTGEKYVCYLCGQGFSRLHILKHHNLLVNPLNYIESTLIASQEFLLKSCSSSSSSLLSANNEEVLRPYVCEICHMRFKLKHHVGQHMRVHTGERPYLCSKCGKTFSQQEAKKTILLLQDLARRYSIGGGETSWWLPSSWSSLSRSALTDLEKKHSCPFCFKSFHRRDHLRQHVRIHTGEKPYKCPACGREFNQRTPLISHKKNFGLQGQVLIHSHIPVRHQQFQMKCQLGVLIADLTPADSVSSDLRGEIILPFTFVNIQGNDHLYVLVVAKESHLSGSRGGQGVISCQYCGKLYQYQSQFEIHLRTHTGERPYLCVFCNKSFIHRHHLKRHTEKSHSQDLIFYTPQTNVSSSGPGLPSMSPATARIEEEALRRHVCKICWKSFKRRDHLVEHVRTHTGEKPYMCQICIQMLMAAAAAAVATTPSLPSPSCSSRIVTSEAETHSRQRQNVKPHLCTVCLRSFKKKDHLREHSVIHTGEKPHVCPYCQKRFTRKRTVKSHIAISHNNV